MNIVADGACQGHIPPSEDSYSCEEIYHPQQSVELYSFRLKYEITFVTFKVETLLYYSTRQLCLLHLSKSGTDMNGICRFSSAVCRPSPPSLSFS